MSARTPGPAGSRRRADGDGLNRTPREVAAVLSGLPVAMLGTSCTIGPRRMLTVAEDLVRYA